MLQLELSFPKALLIAFVLGLLHSTDPSLHGKIHSFPEQKVLHSVYIVPGVRIPLLQ